jgi:hypothetical protein
MKILSHFTYEKKEITTLSLKSEEYAVFLDKLPEHYTYSYIKHEDIKSQKTVYGSTSADIHKEYIPDDPKLMSGEFGEILCQQILVELYENNGFVLEGMKKTLHKEGKNVANHGTDIVLFYRIEETENENDVLISAEVKSKATPSSDSSILKAIKGVETDNISRLAETLIWVRRKFKEEKNIEGFNNVQRFIDPVICTTYKKHFKAIAVIDKNCMKHEETPPIINKIGDDFEIMIILVDDLKDAYQKTLAGTINCIENA